MMSLNSEARVMNPHQSRRDFVRTAAAIAALPFLPRFTFAEAFTQDTLDRDLLETTIPHLHALYDAKKYTVTQVTRWYLNRIARYDDVYRAMIHVDARSALATAAAQDAALQKHGVHAKRGALWGVPIVIKAN